LTFRVLHCQLTGCWLATQGGGEHSYLSEKVRALIGCFLHLELKMSRGLFWGGVAIGAASSAASFWAGGVIARSGRMQCAERSIQIACSAEEVFTACAHLEHMPQLIRSVVSVATQQDDVSRWIADIEGHRIAFDVEIVQVIPKQVIGWKSRRGPKHSGRVTFFALGAERTLVHVEMNHAIRLGGRLDRSASQGCTAQRMEEAVGTALLDLRSALESKRARAAVSPMEREVSEAKATGTYGPIFSAFAQGESKG